MAGTTARPALDGAGGSDLFVDQDDAQSFMQPAISRVATRLTAPSTPAAEKAAALDRLPGGGLFDPPESPDEKLSSSGSSTPEPSRTRHFTPSPDRLPNKLTKSRGRGHSATSSLSGSTRSSLPTPWKAGPRDMIVGEPCLPKPSNSLTGVFGTQGSRQERGSSFSDHALKRLSKAMPSLSMPTGLMSNLNLATPNFFSLSSSHQPGPSSTDSAAVQPPVREPRPQPAARPSVPGEGSPASPASAASPATSNRPPLLASGKSWALRKSTSDDSLLYNSLSRVSSFGDDAERFAHVREQVNSRFKAIKDSFDSPSFKMPQLPPLFKNQPASADPLGNAEAARASSFPVLSRQHNTASPLDSVLECLTGDLVIMGGYRGSILRSAQAPHRQLWVPVKVGLNIRKVNLEVGLDAQDEEDMESQIFASGMLQNIGPVDISRRLFKKLRECENVRSGKLRIHDFGYDWRLSPHILSRKLIEFLETLRSNGAAVAPQHRGALVIAHSLGGLITRHAVNQRPELFSGVVFAGTPQRCINILGPLRNGDAVLLNEKVLDAHVHFSLRTTFIFLPEDGFCFVDKNTKEEYQIDFYNVDDWIKYRLCPSVGEPALPPFLSRSGTFSSLLSLPDSLSGRPLRSRDKGSVSPPPSARDPLRQHHDGTRNLATENHALGATTRNVEYLARTLAETKKFRSELAHDAAHEAAGRYPPLAVIYARDIPTVFAARVASRDAIACADTYDDLVFRSGDGVVLAREAMLPPGYELVRGGRVCTDRGHVTLLGDLQAVGRALDAVVRGRRKGIGTGLLRKDR